MATSEHSSLLENDHMLSTYPGATPKDGAVNSVSADTQRSLRFSDSIIVDPDDPEALLSVLEKTVFLLKRQVDQQQGVVITTGRCASVYYSPTTVTLGVHLFSTFPLFVTIMISAVNKSSC